MWIHQVGALGHVCGPPMRDTGILGQASGRLGDLWRCDDCRKLWRVGRICDNCDFYGVHRGGGQHAVGLAWRPATVWQRIRNRRRR